MAMEPWVHVVGTGTIGEPLIGLLTECREPLGIGRVTFSKNRPTPDDVEKIRMMVQHGAGLCVPPEVADEKTGVRRPGSEAFTAAGYPEPVMLTPTAVDRADVIVDCTPEGKGLAHRTEWYAPRVARDPSFRGAIAQGSEFGFGKPYAYRINEAALRPGEDRFLQVVSCNTHCIAAILHAITQGRIDLIARAHATCIRRASDVSQRGGFIAGLEIGKHDDPRFGTHHARDVHSLFATLSPDALGVPNDPHIRSSAVKAPTQYMHVIAMAMTIRGGLDRDDVLRRLEASPTIALTVMKDAARIFHHGREYGFRGRLYNQAIVNPSTVWAHGDHDETEVLLEAFTPQDGNSLLSSVAAVAWLLDPEQFERRIECVKRYLVRKI